MKGKKSEIIGNDNNAIPPKSEEVINEIPYAKMAMTDDRDVATMISKLPRDVIAKLLMANQQAELEGDHRSLLNHKKLMPLLKEVDPESYKSAKKTAKERVALIVGKNPEVLADAILNLTGVQGRGGLMSEDLRARYPNINKAELVKMGADNLSKMLTAFNTYVAETNIVENSRTNLDVFETFRRQIAIGREPDMMTKIDLDIEEERFHAGLK